MWKTRYLKVLLYITPIFLLDPGFAVIKNHIKQKSLQSYDLQAFCWF